MIKLTKIDGGMYCFLLTFDPNTAVVNIVELQPHGIEDLKEPEESKNASKALKGNQKLNETMPETERHGIAG